MKDYSTLKIDTVRLVDSLDEAEVKQLIFRFFYSHFSTFSKAPLHFFRLIFFVEIFQFDMLRKISYTGIVTIDDSIYKKSL